MRRRCHAKYREKQDKAPPARCNRPQAALRAAPAAPSEQTTIIRSSDSRDDGAGVERSSFTGAGRHADQRSESPEAYRTLRRELEALAGNSQKVAPQKELRVRPLVTSDQKPSLPHGLPHTSTYERLRVDV